MASRRSNQSPAPRPPVPVPYGPRRGPERRRRALGAARRSQRRPSRALPAGGRAARRRPQRQGRRRRRAVRREQARARRRDAAPAVAQGRVRAAKAQLDASARQMSSVAAAAYRTGGAGEFVQLVSTSTPQTFLDRASSLDRIAAGQSAQLADAATARHRLEVASQDAADRRRRSHGRVPRDGRAEDLHRRRPRGAAAAARFASRPTSVAATWPVARRRCPGPPQPPAPAACASATPRAATSRPTTARPVDARP